MFHLYSRKSHFSTDFVYVTIRDDKAHLLAWTVVGKRRKTSQTEESVPVSELPRVYRELRMRGFRRNGR